jgi:hypothetical protein
MKSQYSNINTKVINQKLMKRLVENDLEYYHYYNFLDQ